MQSSEPHIMGRGLLGVFDATFPSTCKSALRYGAGAHAGCTPEGLCGCPASMHP